ncbi:MAG: hypothetical protein M1838_005701 [Thelocarpon superellum]|nr:MAG: hypothetical protein M1838_005701 [Thelocarpon superellum]
MKIASGVLAVVLAVGCADAATLPLSKRVAQAPGAPPQGGDYPQANSLGQSDPQGSLFTDQSDTPVPAGSVLNISTLATSSGAQGAATQGQCGTSAQVPLGLSGQLVQLKSGAIAIYFNGTYVLFDPASRGPVQPLYQVPGPDLSQWTNANSSTGAQAAGGAGTFTTTGGSSAGSGKLKTRQTTTSSAGTRANPAWDGTCEAVAALLTTNTSFALTNSSGPVAIVNNTVVNALQAVAVSNSSSAVGQVNSSAATGRSSSLTNGQSKLKPKLRSRTPLPQLSSTGGSGNGAGATQQYGPVGNNNNEGSISAPQPVFAEGMLIQWWDGSVKVVSQNLTVSDYNSTRLVFNNATMPPISAAGGAAGAGNASSIANDTPAPASGESPSAQAEAASAAALGATPQSNNTTSGGGQGQGYARRGLVLP